MAQMPSRDFLVRQAVLNAIPAYLPTSVEMAGIIPTAQSIEYDLVQGNCFVAAFVRHVNLQFHKLTQQYST